MLNAILGTKREDRSNAEKQRTHSWRLPNFSIVKTEIQEARKYSGVYEISIDALELMRKKFNPTYLYHWQLQALVRSDHLNRSHSGR